MNTLISSDHLSVKEEDLFEFLQKWSENKEKEAKENPNIVNEDEEEKKSSINILNPKQGSNKHDKLFFLKSVKR